MEETFHIEFLLQGVEQHRLKEITQSAAHHSHVPLTNTFTVDDEKFPLLLKEFKTIASQYSFPLKFYFGDPRTTVYEDGSEKMYFSFSKDPKARKHKHKIHNYAAILANYLNNHVENSLEKVPLLEAILVDKLHHSKAQDFIDKFLTTAWDTPEPLLRTALSMHSQNVILPIAVYDHVLGKFLQGEDEIYDPKTWKESIEAYRFLQKK